MDKFNNIGIPYLEGELLIRISAILRMPEEHLMQRINAKDVDDLIAGLEYLTQRNNEKLEALKSLKEKLENL